MYKLECKKVLDKAISINQIVTGSPMYRFYSCESGYILPGHKAELISGVSISIPFEYTAIVKHCLSKEKANHIKCDSYKLNSNKVTPLSILIENVSDQAIKVTYGEVIGTIVLINK